MSPVQVRLGPPSNKKATCYGSFFVLSKEFYGGVGVFSNATVGDVLIEDFKDKVSPIKMYNKTLEEK